MRRVGKHAVATTVKNDEVKNDADKKKLAEARKEIKQLKEENKALQTQVEGLKEENRALLEAGANGDKK